MSIETLLENLTLSMQALTKVLQENTSPTSAKAPTPPTAPIEAPAATDELPEPTPALEDTADTPEPPKAKKKRAAKKKKATPPPETPDAPFEPDTPETPAEPAPDSMTKEQALEVILPIHSRLSDEQKFTMLTLMDSEFGATNVSQIDPARLPEFVQAVVEMFPEE